MNNTIQHIAVVTGASSGLGAEFARWLGREGRSDSIWIIARRTDKLEALAAELGKDRVKIIEADLSSMEGCRLVVGELAAAAGPSGKGLVVDTFVNNAGFGTYGPFEEVDIDWQLNMIDLNIRGLTYLSYEALRYMGQGSVLVNVASLAAFHPLGHMGTYAATKAYVLNFSHVLAAELRSRGIRVTALCPGPVDTEFSRVASRGKRELVMHGKTTAAVVEHCMRKAQRGAVQAILGLDWKLQAWLSRFLTRRFVARMSYRFMGRPH